MLKLHILPDLLDAIRSDAQSAHPHECCGLLIGRRNGGGISVERIKHSPNLSETPEKNFEIDAGLHLRLQRELRDQELEVVGLYHSHPVGEAEPSKTDEAMAWQPDMAWLIAAQEGGQWIVRAYYSEAPGQGFVPMTMKENEQ